VWQSISLILNRIKILGDLFPIIDADEAVGGQTAGGGIEQALTLKAEEVFGQVVDEVDGAEDGFVAAKAEPE
jgi:hypothetical protein